jgi:hypothetical protein
LSYFFLAKSDGGTVDGPEYSVGREFTYIWNVFGDAISQEFTYVWSILQGVSAEIIYKWSILQYISKEFAFIWDIGYYVSREFTYFWNVGMNFGGKVKHSFRTNAVINRFYRIFING